ncbi:MAG: D-tyrosyl-tRNA(Tyr) deacylase [Candidatus Binataceae bacterium]|nr:D-tyrosyl-tRNA(Tyr) deacylase [Candidatus Binataceae bacterium]
MRAIVQRVSRAEVRISGRTIGRIDRGLMVLLGVARGDTDDDAEFMADRIAAMRIFADSEGKMNLALGAAGGAMLVISQFTLLADTSHGRRPSFMDAAQPDEARRLYQYFIGLVRRAGFRVEEGEFGGKMEVDLVNDGPVTIILDSRMR